MFGFAFLFNIILLALLCLLSLFLVKMNGSEGGEGRDGERGRRVKVSECGITSSGCAPLKDAVKDRLEHRAPS